MNKTRRFLLLLGIFSFLLVLPWPTKAFEIKATDSLQIPKGQIVSENIYTIASDIEINGKLDGDLLFVSKNIKVSGEINGDLLCVTQSLDISGEILGDVRTVSEHTNISGKIGNNFNLLGNKAVFKES